jgi:hypothetical protein
VLVGERETHTAVDEQNLMIGKVFEYRALCGRLVDGDGDYIEAEDELHAASTKGELTS